MSRHVSAPVYFFCAAVTTVARFACFVPDPGTDGSTLAWTTDASLRGPGPCFPANFALLGPHFEALVPGYRRLITLFLTFFFRFLLAARRLAATVALIWGSSGSGSGSCGAGSEFKKRDVAGTIFLELRASLVIDGASEARGPSSVGVSGGVAGVDLVAEARDVRPDPSGSRDAPIP